MLFGCYVFSQNLMRYNMHPSLSCYSASHQWYYKSNPLPVLSHFLSELITNPSIIHLQHPTTVTPTVSHNTWICRSQKPRTNQTQSLFKALCLIRASVSPFRKVINYLSPPKVMLKGFQRGFVHGTLLVKPTNLPKTNQQEPVQDFSRPIFPK